MLVFRGNVGQITALKFVDPVGKFNDLLIAFILALLHLQQLLLQTISLALHLFYYGLLAQQSRRKLFFSHPAPFQQLLSFLQLRNHKVKVLLHSLTVDMATNRSIYCIGLMTNHQFDLRFHHAYNLVDMVDFILTRYFLSIKEIGPPDVPQKIVTNQLILKAISPLLIEGTLPFPGLAWFVLRGHSNCQINDINEWIQQINCTYMKSDQPQELRDITINYRELKIEISVPMSKIVSEFFKRELKNYGGDFDKLAVEKKVAGYISLDKLKEYDVTLNSTVRGDNSVLKAGINFGGYARSKKLRFYIHDEQLNQEQPMSENNKTITLCLISGNVSVQERRVDIPGMKLQEFQKMVRDLFCLDPTINFNYMNMKERTFISLGDKHSLPIKIFNQARINKVGIYPIFEAGGNDLYRH